MNFNKFKNSRLEFLETHKQKDHVILKGTSNVLISVPHAVSQVRLGKRKPPEIGSLPVALFLKENSSAHLIAKTKNNFDDANFDQVSDYKDSIDSFVMNNKIDYLIDIHGLASFRPVDVNLGVNFGANIKTNIPLFDSLKSMLEEGGFSVSIDQPFSGGGTTIAGSSKLKHPHLWTVQIEINCAITNKKENFDKNKKLISILSKFINSMQ